MTFLHRLSRIVSMKSTSPADTSGLLNDRSLWLRDKDDFFVFSAKFNATIF